MNGSMKWGLLKNGEMMGNNTSRVTNQTLRRIGYQFPRCPHGRMMFAIVSEAVRGSQSKIPDVRRRERSYLSGYIYHAEVAGVDSQWIRETLQKAENHGKLGIYKRDAGAKQTTNDPDG